MAKPVMLTADGLKQLEEELDYLKGEKRKEIAEKITQERENIHFVAMLDTLEFLKRGGRISKTAGFSK